MIERLQLQDFKAFRQLDIAVRPLTVLVGENNSGKSSVLASLRLLSQTIQSEDSSIPLLLSGPLGDFGAFRDVVHGNHRGRPMALGLTLSSVFPRSAERMSSVSFRSEFKYRTQRRETILRSTEVTRGHSPLIAVHASTERDSLVISKIAGWTPPESARAALGSRLIMRNFLANVTREAARRRSRSEDVTEGQRRLDEIELQVAQSVNSIRATLSNVEHIGSMRRPPERTYVHTGVEGRYVGADGANWPAMLALDASRRSPRLGLVQSWLRASGIADRVAIHWLTDRHFEIIVTNPKSRETANIADVGQGTSQVLPVVIAGARLGRGDTYIVEEPEIHLHPRAQAALGDYFLDLVKAGVQSFVETHSEYFIMRLQQHVAAGRLAPQDVIFYYVSSEPNGKRVTQLHLNASATFEPSLPGGFFPQRMTEASALAKARSRPPEG